MDLEYGKKTGLFLRFISKFAFGCGPWDWRNYDGECLFNFHESFTLAMRVRLPEYASDQ